MPDARLGANVTRLDSSPTFTGTVQAAGFTLASNAAPGRLLTSDASGHGTWQAGLWTVEGTNIYFTNGVVGIGTNAPSAPLHVHGPTRLNGTVRMGSETDTAEPPAQNGLIVRRINSTASSIAVVARTDVLSLERDNTFGGWRISYSVWSGQQAVACMGISSAGTTRNLYQTFSTGTTTIYPDSDNVVFFRCLFGNLSGNGHHTEVSLAREANTSIWVGTLTSTYDQ